jgi:CheY-like chemotaxis protein
MLSLGRRHTKSRSSDSSPSDGAFNFRSLPLATTDGPKKSSAEPATCQPNSFLQESANQNYDMLQEVLFQCTNIDVECVETLDQLEAVRRELLLGDSAAASMTASMEMDGGNTNDNKSTLAEKPRVVVVCLAEIPGRTTRSNTRSFRRFLSSYFISDGPTRSASHGYLLDEWCTGAPSSAGSKQRADVWLITGVSETVNCFLNSCVFKYSGPTQASGECPTRQTAFRRRTSPRGSRSNSDAPTTSTAMGNSGLQRSCSERRPSDAGASGKVGFLGKEPAQGKRPSKGESGEAALGRCAPLTEAEQRVLTREKRATSVDANTTNDSPRARKQVLVVEDNPMNQKLIRNILVREGYEVQTASPLSCCKLQATHFCVGFRWR